jgi:hypothetical protein
MSLVPVLVSFALLLVLRRRVGRRTLVLVTIECV